MVQTPVKPMAQPQSIIQQQLLFAIDQVLGDLGIAQAFPELRCNFAGRSIVPDIAVFESHRIPENELGEVDNEFGFSPDWVIEISSPEQNTSKALSNIKLCLAHGTQMGWIIDTEDRSVIVIKAGQVFEAITFGANGAIDEPSAILPVPEFAKSIQLTTADIFSWLKKSKGY
jgi:Uma2 family endonuclease